MKAVLYHQYGDPTVLHLEEIERPTPKKDQVLIKVAAVSLNASDNEFLTGSPAYTRAWGLTKPRNKILGSDISGIVEEIGSDVTIFKKGDAVFGDLFDSWGGLAEYVCAPEDKLMKKPDGLSFEDAASLPQASLVALQSLRDNAKVQSGQQILINGAGGGCGSFAIQIAKMLGAEITAVDSAGKFDTMVALGADHVIDYRSEDFTKIGRQYDLILDLVAAHSIFDYKRALKAKGKYLMVGGHMSHLFQTLIYGSMISLFSKKKMTLLAAKPNKGLAYMAELVLSGKIRTLIDRRYQLSETADAFRRLGEGEAVGKLVIQIK